MINPGTQEAMSMVRVVDGRSNGHTEFGLELPPVPKDTGCVEIIEVTAGGGEEVARGLEEKHPAGNSTAVGAVANFVNTIVGAGILGLPFAIAEVRDGLGARQRANHTTDYQEVNGFDPNGSETADRMNSYPAGNSSAVGAVANYVNTIVGAAIVGLPFALKQTFLGMGPITSTRHYTITLLIWAFTMTVACATHDLSIVLDIFGALSSTVIGYILPALLHISCNREDIRRAGALWRKDSPEYDTSLCGRLWALRILCLPVFMVVFGIVAMVVGVVSAVWFELKNFGLN